MFKRFISILLGIVLIFIGFRGPIIGIAGTNATAFVTGTKQVVSKTSKKSERNYSISYKFNDAKGKETKGAYQLNRVYDIQKLPAIGSSLTIRYFKLYSGLSVPAGRLLPGLNDLLVILAGIAVLLFGKGRKRTANSQRYQG